MIRVATYNILHARLKGLEAIASVLLSSGADLIGLQEVDRGVTRSGGMDQAGVLAGKLGFHHAFASACPWDDGLYGLAVLSRFPILRHRKTELPGRAILSLPDGAEPRIVLEAELDLGGHPLGAGGAPLRFATTHFGLDPTERLLQAEAAARLLGGRERTILCGDLNEGHTEAGFAKLAASFVDCLGEVAPLPLRSYPADAPTIGIDHVLRSADLPPASSASAIFVDTSDHLPVIVDLG